MKLDLKNIDLKNEKVQRFLIYLALIIIFFIRHFDLTYVGDDYIMAPGAAEMTLWEAFVFRWGYNGRIITDVFAFFWYYFPMMVWKIFDTVLYAFAAMLITRVFTRNTVKDLFVVSLLLLLFPFKYMESAGYVATSANYFYPVFAILVVTLHIKYVLENKKVPIPMYFASALSIIYYTNHDQTAVGLLGCMACYFGYCLLTKQNAHLTKHVGGLFAASGLVYGLSFLIPGHMGRSNSDYELNYWFPEYVEWNFAEKVYHGYTSTVANLFFNNIALFILFAILLLLVSLKQKKIYNIVIAAIPLGGVLLCNTWGLHRFIYYFERSIGMPELIPVQMFPIPFVLSVLMIAAAFYTIWNCIDKLEDKLMLTMLLVMGAGTREMMGFTFTIYASSYRTFTFFLYALILCCIVLLRQLEDDNERKNYWYIGLGAMIALLM